MKPAANMDTTSFDWPLPKLHRVRNYCREQLGWTELEMDQQVDTVIERYANRSHQVPHCSALCCMIGLFIALYALLARVVVCIFPPSQSIVRTKQLTSHIHRILPLSPQTSQPRIDSFFMTYHDGNRAARFRSSRLGAAVEQITGKRTELSLGSTVSSARGKPKKARVTKEKEKEVPVLSLSPLDPKGNGKGKRTGSSKGKGKAAKAVTPLERIDEVPSEVLLPDTAQQASGSVGAASVTEQSPCVLDLVCEEDSDEDVFDDNYKKSKSTRKKGRR